MSHQEGEDDDCSFIRSDVFSNCFTLCSQLMAHTITHFHITQTHWMEPKTLTWPRDYKANNDAMVKFIILMYYISPLDKRPLFDLLSNNITSFWLSASLWIPHTHTHTHKFSMHLMCLTSDDKMRFAGFLLLFCFLCDQKRGFIIK